MTLTQGQKRILDEVLRHGKKVYNGRARSQINALEKAGLVESQWDMRAGSMYPGGPGVWRITVRPTSPKALDSES